MDGHRFDHFTSALTTRADRRRVMRFVSVVGLLVTLALTGLTPLPAGAEDTDQCKDGGWATLRDAADQPFKNQGQCVSYAAQGGAFAPVGTIDLALAATSGPICGPFGQCIALTITGSDLAPGTDVTLTATVPGGVPGTEVVGQVLADGTVFIQSGQVGVGHIQCGRFTALAVSAVDAGGATVTDTAALPC